MVPNWFKFYFWYELATRYFQSKSFLHHTYVKKKGSAVEAYFDTIMFCLELTSHEITSLSVDKPTWRV